MSCGCIKKRFDIHLSSIDCRTLIIEDESLWMSQPGNTKPDTYDVTITIPSRNIQVTLTLFTERRNKITSVELLGTSELECLPDDIYCFEVESCGLKYKISRANTCNIRGKIDELYASERYELVEEFEMDVQSIDSAVRSGMIDTALGMFQLLNDKLDKIDCETC